MPAPKSVSLECFQSTMEEMSLKLDTYFSRLDAELANIKDIVIMRLQEENTQLRTKVECLEKSLESNLQYQRRNNIILDGIPLAVENKHIEKTSIKILNAINVDISEKDVEACHRLPSSNVSRPPPVVVRFVNRKNADKAISNRSKLKNIDKTIVSGNNIYINHHLTRFFSSIAWKCRGLRRKGLVESVSVSNEAIKIFYNGRSVKITDSKRLEELFPAVDFGFPRDE